MTVSSPSATPASVTIPVSLSVGAAPPIVLVQPQILAFSFGSGAGPHNAALSVSNLGGGIISFSASVATDTGGNWLQVSPTFGAVTAGVTGQINVLANPGILAAGTYTGSISISTSDAILPRLITVQVIMTIASTPAQLLLSQTGLTFAAVVQGGAPSAQSVEILNTGPGSLNWAAAVSTLSGGGWLSTDQSKGTTSFANVSTVNVTVDPTGLTVGSYYAQITITADVSNSPQTVSVILNVLPPGSTLGPDVRPTGLVFVGSSGSTPGSQSVAITNLGLSPIGFASSPTYLSATTGWLPYIPTSATVAPGRPANLTVQPDLNGLQPGIQRAAITLLFTDGTIRTVSVLTVVAPDPPGSVASTASHLRATQDCASLIVQPTTLTDALNTINVGEPTPIQVRVIDSCGEVLTDEAGVVTATFSNGDSPLKLVDVGNGNWRGTWTPQNAGQSTSTIQINASSGQGSIISGGTNLPVAVLSRGVTPLPRFAVNAASELRGHCCAG